MKEASFGIVYACCSMLINCCGNTAKQLLKLLQISEFAKMADSNSFSVLHSAIDGFDITSIT
jgi:L-2-hydroxyglutarate oxidase LhgO